MFLYTEYGSFTSSFLVGASENIQKRLHIASTTSTILFFFLVVFLFSIYLSRAWEDLEIERAVERVRAEAMTMHSSDDLLKVAVIMWQELSRLGIETPTCVFFFVDEDEGRILGYSAIENPRIYGISWTSPELREIDKATAVAALKEPITVDWEEDLGHWREGKIWSVTRSRKADQAETQSLHELYGLDRYLPFTGPEWVVTNVPFTYGWVSVRHRETSKEHASLVQKLTAALSLGYVRFLDFKQLEKQNQTLEKTLHQLRETQNQLVMQEKMASLGDLVAGVAHEMNTPVGTINSMHDTLIRAIDKLKETLGKVSPDHVDNPTIQSMFKMIADAHQVMSTGIGRIADIIRSLRNFARLDEAEYQVADLHEGIESALTLLQAQIEDDITIVKNFGDLQPIYCSPGQLNQVIMNLLRNAAQTIEGKGEIRIRTFKDDSKVYVQISDTGVGLPPEQLKRIFDIGFKATDSRVEMGFGLSTEYNIIQEHKGEIEIKSEVGKGTEVTISLPLNQPSEATRKRAPQRSR